MRTPFKIALPILDTPPHVLSYGAGPRLVIIWRDPVCPALYNAAGEQLVPEDFKFYDCLAMDEAGTHFKVRLDRATVDAAVRQPSYFVEADDIRAPTLGISGHGGLVNQPRRG